MRLRDSDRALLAGAEGPAGQVAMRIVVEMARVAGAAELLDVTSAHIDGCLYHGQAGLDFAERLLRDGAAVRVPTTLNVASLDLLHPDRFRGDPATATAARRLMDAYVAMGCRQTWTCAPYQLPERPGFGEHVAWAESNAIVFANSVLGARTARYGDFIDICAAITGRVPHAGLHLTDRRRGQLVFDVRGLPERLGDQDLLYPLLGHLIGARSGRLVPVVDGLPAAVTEDRLKAVGAAAASSGEVGLVHVVGSTPEAPTLAEALQHHPAHEVVQVTPAMLRTARDQLTTAGNGSARLVGVNVGTPHFSEAEFGHLVSLLAGRPVHPEVEFYASTGRHVLARIEALGWAASLEAAGVRLVVDTCTYVTSILEHTDGVVMTSSAKWAWYAPGNLGVRVALGSLRECVESAVEGRIVRDDAFWPQG
ncbi:MAG TPA: aconitase X catalytic domain-containing protein [Actinomycetota bacterium]|nr:aconitase X catalytic domain-containing protein [Actinomycetota bacterium]